MANKMKACAQAWKRAGKPGKWTTYAGRCMRKGAAPKRRRSRRSRR